MKSEKRPAHRPGVKWEPLTRVPSRESKIRMRGDQQQHSEVEKEDLPSIFAVEKANKKLLEESSKFLFLEKSTLEYSTRGLEKRLESSTRRLDAEELIDLVWRCGGDLRQAANVCGAKRGAVKRWLKLDGNLEVLEEIDEAWNDVAENVVNSKLLDGNLQAAQFRLETKAKGRGYVRKQEVDISQVIQVVLEGDAPETIELESKEVQSG